MTTITLNTPPELKSARLKAKTDRKRRSSALRLFVGLSLLLHLLLFLLAVPLWPWLVPEADPGDAIPVNLVLLDPETWEPEEPTPPTPTGQIVDLPKPETEEVPEEADYLAEHDRKVEKETMTEQFKVNPEVVTPEFSQDSKLELEDLLDLKMTDPSTGARVGNDRFDPDRDGSLASVPSPYAVTNRDGLQAPVPVSHATERVAGAPNNDLLDEERGKSVNLNTHEFLGADYINRIRTLVNFYWQQNLDNLPPGLRLAKARFETAVDVTLTEQGVLENILVSGQSGSSPLDYAVVEAFKMAGPFPHPPEQLVTDDGRVILPHMTFTVQVGQAKMQYMGVDPRQGVQFPGILKSPR